MNYQNVVFYNSYGNGDLWASREFIKEMMLVLPGLYFYYSHAKNHHLFFDMPELSFRPLDENCLMREPYVICGDTLYINTWIGYAYGKYVFPGVTVSLENMRRMFEDTLQAIGINYRFLNNTKDYVPTPDFDFLEDIYYENINRWVYDNVDRPIVLISNGDVYSNQAANFDFAPYINDMVKRYKDVLFIATEKYKSMPRSLLLTEDIIGKKDGTDLPEIGYLSTFVDSIVGRSSGPFVFAQTYFNYNNPDLYLLSYTYEKSCAHMLSQSESRATLAWYGGTDEAGITEELEKAVKWSLHE